MTVPGESVPLDEPDCIARLLVGRYDRLPLPPARTAKPQGTKLEQRAAPFLDILAQLLVCEEQGQAVALSVVFDCLPDAPDSRLLFFVAQHNSVDDSVPECVPKHLLFILGKLSEARRHAIARHATKGAEASSAAKVGSNEEADEEAKGKFDPHAASLSLGIPAFISPTTSDPLEKALLDLEYGLLRHSRQKLYKRLVAADRYTHFRTLAHDILDDSLHNRGMITAEELPILNKLKDQTARDGKLLSSLRILCRGLGHLHTILSTQPGEELDVETLRKALYWISKASSVETFSTFAKDFNDYMRQYLASNDKRTMKNFDLEHWLAKLVYIHNGFNKFIRLLGSRTFSRVFSVAFKVECVPRTCLTPSKGHFTATSDTVEELLEARGIKVGDEKRITKFLQDTESGMVVFISKMCGSLNVGTGYTDQYNSEVRTNTSTHSTKEPDSKTLTLGTHVHCECAVLAHLDVFLHEHPACEEELIPYIGISKRPCLLCDDYIGVYNSVTGRNIRTAYTHGQVVPWRRPILESNEEREENVRAALHSRLVNRLWNKISSSTLSSLDSQTSVASEASDGVSPDVDMILTDDSEDLRDDFLAIF
ncbi:hypothetical protein C8Q76DRAFT_862139 [Earliella scabrosa]|nr:hypothetical protein C8Q76DRAFT_862139 [Earliella scabrosa]